MTWWHLFIQVHYPPNHFLSAPCHFLWPSFSHWRWHLIAEPLTHIIKSNLYYPLTPSASLHTRISQTGRRSLTHVWKCHWLSVSIQYAVLRRTSKTLFQENLSPSLSRSPSVLLVWQLAQGSSPSLCFCPSAHSALPKAQRSSSTTQSWQSPTGGRQVCISARQLSLQQSGVTVNGNFFPHSSQDSLKFCVA